MADNYFSYDQLAAATTSTILTNNTGTTWFTPTYTPTYIQQPNYIQPDYSQPVAVWEDEMGHKKKDLDDPIQWLEHRVQEMLWYE